MSAWRSDPRAGGALALALVLAGCPTREPEAQPFRLDVQVAGGGSLVDRFPNAGLLTVSGTATVVDATTLLVAGTAQGDLTLTFDRAAVPALAFPARLDGQPVLLEIFLDPAGKGPDGEARGYDGYRVANAVTLSYELAIGEWTSELGLDPRGVPLPPPPFAFRIGDEDLPILEIEGEWKDWEPSDCGLVYYAPLQVVSPEFSVALERGEEVAVVVGGRQDPIRVHHVVTFHRAGSCDGKSRAWTQVAAWR